MFAAWRARILTSVGARHAPAAQCSNPGPRKWLPGWPAGAAAVFALAFAITGDPLAILIGIVPIFVEALASWVRRGEAIRLVGAAYCVLVFAVVYLMQSIRGFTTSGLGTRFVSWDQLGSNISLTAHGILNLFGADFFGQDVLSGGTILILLHLLGLGFAGWALARAVRAWVQGAGDDWISTVLMLGCLVSLIEFAVSALPAGLNSTRYLIPALVFGAALAGRVVGTPAAEWGESRFRTTVLAIAGYSAAALISFLLVLSRPIPGPWPDGIPQLVEWLSVRGLHNGWGVYRASSIATVESGGRITVRPVDGQLNQAGPSTYLWYSETPPEFIVWAASAEVGAIDPHAIADTFGPPTAVATVGQFRVATLNGRR